MFFRWLFFPSLPSFLPLRSVPIFFFFLLPSFNLSKGLAVHEYILYTYILSIHTYILVYDRISYSLLINTLIDITIAIAIASTATATAATATATAAAAAITTKESHYSGDCVRKWW